MKITAEEGRLLASPSQVYQNLGILLVCRRHYRSGGKGLEELAHRLAREYGIELMPATLAILRQEEEGRGIWGRGHGG